MPESKNLVIVFKENKNVKKYVFKNTPRRRLPIVL